MYYTWLDIEWKLKSERAKWPQSWVSIEVYSDELIIYRKKGILEFAPESDFLDEVFGPHWNSDKNTISMAITNKQMQIVFEDAEIDPKKRPPLPLFKQSFYHEADILAPALDKKLPVPVIAFHSYKGGVGRTLSLVSLARELSFNKKKYKVLIVDADIEAPGLTLMAKSFGFPSENRISYLDILSIIHDSERESLFNIIARNIARAMVTSTIKIPAKDVTEEHYFLPAYRIGYQLLDNFVHPEHIISMPDRTFIISEFLSELGKHLNVNAVIVDLRAGLSELSAPLIFDPRVRRIFVTSTSWQSTEGTKFILETIFKSPFSQELLLRNTMQQQEIVTPTILLTMVPCIFAEEKLRAIKFDLIQKIPVELYKTETHEEDDETLSDIVIHSEHSEGLIHLDDLAQICDALSETSMAQATEILAKRLIVFSVSQKKSNASITDKYRGDIIEKINNIVSKEITAEGSFSVNMMATDALEKLAKDFSFGIPKVVIPGAKGSGKTYIYKQLLENTCWENFVSKILLKPETQHKTILIMPVLASKNRTQLFSLFDKCLNEVNQAIGASIEFDLLNENEQTVNQYRDTSNLKQNDWFDIWNTLFLKSLSSNIAFKSFAELDSKMGVIGKKLIFIIDGLEDIFNQTLSSENSKLAIRVLCQDFINNIFRYKNIGVLIFIRSDMLQSAIQINREQFESQYSSYTLKWSQDEAQRLVIWILAQAQFKEYDTKKVKIPKLTHNALSEYLDPFWGKKLGRITSNEAFSSRWIIAALSDFNKQIQARDIIRFLKYATDNPSKDLYYHDRVLLPTDIRKAIIPCSRDKRSDISAEMKNLDPIFKTLESIPESEKILPLPPDAIKIDVKDRNQLEAQGYLKFFDGYYYFPEIIRHALGYTYSHGQRPKVLSLLIGGKT
jgi:hypothetical protein